MSYPGASGAPAGAFGAQGGGAWPPCPPPLDTSLGVMGGAQTPKGFNVNHIFIVTSHNVYMWLYIVTYFLETSRKSQMVNTANNCFFRWLLSCCYSCCAFFFTTFYLYYKGSWNDAVRHHSHHWTNIQKYSPFCRLNIRLYDSLRTDLVAQICTLHFSRQLTPFHVWNSSSGALSLVMPRLWSWTANGYLKHTKKK